MGAACRVLDFPGAKLSWREIEWIMQGGGHYHYYLIDRLGRLSLEELNNLRNGNYYDAPKELVEAARNLQGCEWLG